jgi:DNA-binding MltR family transcriptional regulator
MFEHEDSNAPQEAVESYLSIEGVLADLRISQRLILDVLKPFVIRGEGVEPDG